VEMTPQERRTFCEESWKIGGFKFWLGNCKDTLENELANSYAYEFWREKTLERIRTPHKAEVLVPEKAPHYFGTKRISLERNYYEALDQDHVDIVDVKSNPIDEVLPNGIRTSDDVVHELDIIVLATGFDAVTGGLLNMNIHGLNDVALKDVWQNGYYTYLGMGIHGFPNMFFPYGPQAPTAFCNGPSCAELQGEWIRKTVDYMFRNRKTRIHPSAESQTKWKKIVSEIGKKSLISVTDSWYTGANVPGKHREMLNYLGGLPQYTREIYEEANNDYQGFILH
jgi:cation diffusion facilitator CzcD-associated flavoprotein CzcO